MPAAAAAMSAAATATATRSAAIETLPATTGITTAKTGQRKQQQQAPLYRSKPQLPQQLQTAATVTATAAVATMPAATAAMPAAPLIFATISAWKGSQSVAFQSGRAT